MGVFTVFSGPPGRRGGFRAVFTVVVRVRAAPALAGRCRAGSRRAAGPLPERPQRRSLFDSMSNHMANSVNCDPKMRRRATSTTVPTETALPRSEHDLRDPEAEPEQRHQEAEGVEEDQRMKVADDVLLPHPPEEALDQQPRDARDDPADPDPRLLADAVHRPRRDIAHPARSRRSGGRACRWETRSRVDTVEIELPEDLAARNRVAGL